MSSHFNSLSDAMIERRIEALKDVPARDPLQAVSGRARFLREAAQYRQAVSPGIQERQSGWTFFIRKEKLAMTALVSLALAFILVLSGGATVAAAQNDLPDQSLYTLKLWTEDARLAMTGDPQEQAELLMTMAQTRVEEMAALAEKEVMPPDRVRERLETHLSQTLNLAANMEDVDLEGTLLQLQERLQQQEHILQRSQEHAGADIAPQLTRTRQMLQTQLRLAEQGLADPQTFRHMLRNGPQFGPGESATPNQPGESGNHQNGPTAQPTHQPGPGNENGNCDGSGSPCGPNPEPPHNDNCGNNGPCGEEPGGHHPEEPHGGNGGDGPEHEKPGGSQDGNGSGGENGGEGGSGGENGGGGGSGAGGGNK